MTEKMAFELVSGSEGDFRRAVEALRRSGPFCLIGGLAVNTVAEPVYTMDADFAADAATAERAAEELAKAGFKVERFPHSINARWPGSRLSIQVTSEEAYSGFPRRSSEMEVLGESVPVAVAEDLVAGKLMAWADPSRRPSKRQKDIMDVTRMVEARPELARVLTPEARAEIERASRPPSSHSTDESRNFLSGLKPLAPSNPKPRRKSRGI